MIRHPKPGTPVRLRYAKKFARLFPHHGAAGSVLTAGKGPGPRNMLVCLAGVPVVVPAGNLIPDADASPAGRSPARSGNHPPGRVPSTGVK